MTAETVDLKLFSGQRIIHFSLMSHLLEIIP